MNSIDLREKWTEFLERKQEKKSNARTHTHTQRIIKHRNTDNILGTNKCCIKYYSRLLCCSKIEIKIKFYSSFWVSNVHTVSYVLSIQYWNNNETCRKREKKREKRRISLSNEMRDIDVTREKESLHAFKMEYEKWEQNTNKKTYINIYFHSEKYYFFFLFSSVVVMRHCSCCSGKLLLYCVVLLV